MALGGAYKVVGLQLSSLSFRETCLSSHSLRLSSVVVRLEMRHRDAGSRTPAGHFTSTLDVLFTYKQDPFRCDLSFSESLKLLTVSTLSVRAESGVL